MKILELSLYTNQFDKIKQFYTEHFGFDYLDDNQSRFSIKIGWTKLTFIKSKEEHHYHYAFLISKSQFEASYQWASQHLTILEIQKNEHIAFFEDWKAQSFYFYDGGQNLVEIIAHDEIDTFDSITFSGKSILGISEIGLPTSDIQSTNSEIELLTGSTFWKGDSERFGTNGSAEGKILLPNYHIKKTWFPTEMIIKPAPMQVSVEINATIFELNFP